MGRRCCCNNCDIWRAEFPSGWQSYFTHDLQFGGIAPSPGSTLFTDEFLTSIEVTEPNHYMAFSPDTWFDAGLANGNGLLIEILDSSDTVLASFEFLNDDQPPDFGKQRINATIGASSTVLYANDGWSHGYWIVVKPSTLILRSATELGVTNDPVHLSRATQDISEGGYGWPVALTLPIKYRFSAIGAPITLNNGYVGIGRHEHDEDGAGGLPTENPGCPRADLCGLTGGNMQQSWTVQRLDVGPFSATAAGGGNTASEVRGCDVTLGAESDGGFTANQELSEQLTVRHFRRNAPFSGYSQNSVIQSNGQHTIDLNAGFTAVIDLNHADNGGAAQLQLTLRLDFLQLVGGDATTSVNTDPPVGDATYVGENIVSNTGGITTIDVDILSIVNTSTMSEYIELTWTVGEPRWNDDNRPIVTLNGADADTVEVVNLVTGTRQDFATAKPSGFFLVEQVAIQYIERPPAAFPFSAAMQVFRNSGGFTMTPADIELVLG